MILRSSVLSRFTIVVGVLRRGEDAGPGIHVEPGDAGLVQGGSIGNERAALEARHRERVQAAGLDVRQAEDQVAEHHRHPAAEHVIDRRRRASCRAHAARRVPAQVLEASRRPRRRTCSRSRSEQFLRVGLGVGDQLLDRFRRDAGMSHRDDEGVASDPSDGGEVLHRIVGDVLHRGYGTAECELLVPIISV